MCVYLVGVVAQDLELQHHFPEIPADSPPFFGTARGRDLCVPDVNLADVFERLVTHNPNSDTYFSCLAALHKARQKYERILSTQPIPTLEQVGPRGLLQFGHVSPRALAGLLFWRKWLYDIDNRAAQETGYLFEPIIAHAIGGVPSGAKTSPIKRHRDNTKGRQVDCVRERRAYEIKIRVTIAASGQGRWNEELEFPRDCQSSGYTPVLIVLDSTTNPKLESLAAAFRAQGGEVYTGAAAWEHLDTLAGATMAQFLEKYIRAPLQAMLESDPEPLAKFSAEKLAGRMEFTIGDETLVVDRTLPEEPTDDDNEFPDDAAGVVPGI